MLPVAPGFALWDDATVDIDASGLSYRVTLRLTVENGQPVVAGLEVHRRKNGPPITPEALRRLPLGALLREVASRAAWTVRPAGGKSVSLRPLMGDDDAGFRRALRQRTRAGRPPMTDKELETVAATYRAALSRGEAPTRAVETAMNVSRSHGGKLVVTARKKGFLGPTEPGKAGERATRSRRSATRRGGKK